MSGAVIEVDEFEDRDPGGEVTIAMIHSEPAVLCWQVRDYEAALAAAGNMGLPIATCWSVAEAVGFYPDAHTGSAEERDQ